MHFSRSIAAALAAALLLALPVSAAGTAGQPEAPAAETAETAAKAAVISEVGKRRLPVTSAMSEGAGQLSLRALFDGRADTGVKVDLTGAEDKTFRLYTSSSVPQTLAAFGVLTDGTPGTLVTLHVYGTDDSTLAEWTPVPLIGSVDEQNGFRVFHIQNPYSDWKDAPAFTFYRFDFTVDAGDSGENAGIGFNVSEVVLLRPESDEPDLKWDLGDSVDLGELPPLVPVNPEENAEAAETEAAGDAETAEQPAEQPAAEAEETKPLWNSVTGRTLFGPFRFGAFPGSGR